MSKSSRSAKPTKPPKPRRTRAKSVLNLGQIQRFINVLEKSRILDSSDRRKLVAELKRGPHAFTIQDRARSRTRPGRKKKNVIYQHVRDCVREHVAEYALALQAENPSIRKKASIGKAIMWADERYPTFKMRDSTLYAAIAKFRLVHGVPRSIDVVKTGNGKTRDEIKELMEDPGFDPNELLSEIERQDIDRQGRRFELEEQYRLIGERLADQHLESVAAGFEGPLADAFALNDDDISEMAKLRSILRDAAFDAFFSRMERRLEERFAASVRKP